MGVYRYIVYTVYTLILGIWKTGVHANIKTSQKMNRSIIIIYRLQKIYYIIRITDLCNKLNWLNTEDSINNIIGTIPTYNKGK